jgi:hypothetical protein
MAAENKHAAYLGLMSEHTRRRSRVRLRLQRFFPIPNRMDKFPLTDLRLAQKVPDIPQPVVLHCFPF